MDLADSKEVGLAVGHLLGKHIFQFEELHYGLWDEGLEVKIANYAKAQARYSQHLISHIPDGVQKILDVGSGTGELAQRLITKGYQVTCVSPSTFLTEQVRRRLKDDVMILQDKFESIPESQTYDLLCFSESFQYVDPKLSLPKAARMLVTGGYLLISDFFKRSIAESPLGGGHLLSDFNEWMKPLPFEIVLDKDITAQTAPTMQMFGDLLNDVGVPLRDLVCGFIKTRHPQISRLIAWKFRQRFEKINRKFFSSTLNGESFTRHKSYRFLLYRKT